MSNAARHTLRMRARRAIVGTSVTLAIVAAAPAAALACEGTSANPNEVAKETINTATICLINEERTSRGVRALKVNDRLDRASVRHAKDMVARRYFAHGNFIGRIRAARYMGGSPSYLVAENIAWGSMSYATPKSIVRRWMASPGHRANILNGRLREIGIGIARGAPVGGMRDAATYVTDFGTRR